MASVTLIYCADGNRRFADIAISAGFKYGAQLPNKIYFPLYFADQNWRKPDRAAYMSALAKHRPEMATVLDWERDEQLPEVLSWAEEGAQYANRVLIIPKVNGGVSKIPRRVGGADVILAYSVPSKYGGTKLPLWDFAGWPVHLLGGSPNAQIKYYLHLAGICDVVSADGNYMLKMALSYCSYYSHHRADVPNARRHPWVTLVEADGERWKSDALYEAFRRSCVNIMTTWKTL
ncbi:MAG TPA: DUF6610 family protein [Levilinea sp.]|nr:DUF6610 family protein [Levilinea sp.]